MALVTPDFTEVASIQPGTYKATIKKGTLGEWPSSGTKYVEWEYETTTGRTIKDKTPITGKGAFRTQNLYRAATGAALTGSFDTEQLVGKQVQIEVAEGTKQDGTASGYMEVKKVTAVAP